MISMLVLTFKNKKGEKKMKKIKIFLIKHAGTLAAIALMIGISSLDSACYVSSPSSSCGT